MERFRIVRALGPGQPNILKHIKDQILLCGNCPQCVNCCMSAGLQVGMERFHVVHALRPGRPNILIYIKEEILCVGTYTPCYAFITLFFHGVGLHQYYQSQPNQKNFIQEALDDSNTRQQCPKVGMWYKPPTEENALVGILLRRSSQKMPVKQLIPLDRWWMKGFGTKAADNMGPTKGRPLVPAN